MCLCASARDKKFEKSFEKKRPVWLGVQFFGRVGQSADLEGMLTPNLIPMVDCDYKINPTVSHP